MAPARWNRLAQAAGFRTQYVDVRTCDGPDAVAQLILASSCTPPFTPVLTWEGRRVIDGGLLESVPISPIAAAGQRALVLMTRAPRAGESFVDAHDVVWPSRPLTVSVVAMAAKVSRLDDFSIMGIKEKRCFSRRC